MRVEFYDYAVREAGDVGYAVGRERGALRRGDDVLTLAIRTTRVYQWMDGRWRQVHHHGSMDDPGTLAQYQRAVAAGKRDATPGSESEGGIGNDRQFVDGTHYGRNQRHWSGGRQ